MGSGHSLPTEHVGNSLHHSKERLRNSRSNSALYMTVKSAADNNNNTEFLNATSKANHNNNNNNNNNNNKSGELRPLVSSSLSMLGVPERPSPSSQSGKLSQNVHYDQVRRVNLKKKNTPNRQHKRKHDVKHHDKLNKSSRKSTELKTLNSLSHSHLKPANSCEKRETNVLRRSHLEHSASTVAKSTSSTLTLTKPNSINNMKPIENDKNNKISTKSSNYDKSKSSEITVSNTKVKETNTSETKSASCNAVLHATELENKHHDDDKKEEKEYKEKQELSSLASPSMMVQRKAHEMRRGSRISSRSNSHLLTELQGTNSKERECPETKIYKEEQQQEQNLQRRLSTLSRPISTSSGTSEELKILESSVITTPKITHKTSNFESKINSNANTITTNNNSNNNNSNASIPTRVSADFLPRDMKQPPLPILQTCSSFRTSNTSNTNYANRLRSSATSSETKHNDHLPIISLNSEKTLDRDESSLVSKGKVTNNNNHNHNDDDVVADKNIREDVNSSISNINTSADTLRHQRETVVFNSNDFISIGLHSTDGNSVIQSIPHHYLNASAVTTNNNNNNSKFRSYSPPHHLERKTSKPEEQSSSPSLLMLQPQLNSQQSDGWSRSLNSRDELNCSVLTDVANEPQTSMMDVFEKYDEPINDNRYISNGFDDFETSNNNINNNNNNNNSKKAKEVNTATNMHEERQELLAENTNVPSNDKTHPSDTFPMREYRTNRLGKNKHKFVFGESHSNEDEESKRQNSSSNTNDEVANGLNKPKSNNPFQEKAKKHRNSTSRSQGFVTFYGSSEVCAMCGDSNVAYVSAKHHTANNSINNNNSSNTTITSTNNKNKGKDKLKAEEEATEKLCEFKENVQEQCENAGKEGKEEQEEEQIYMCEKCYFADDGAHEMVPLQEVHCMNSRTCISSSGTSLTTNTNNWGTGSEAAISTFFYNPCALCEKIIDDTEVVYRCEKCDYIICESCYNAHSDNKELLHKDPLKRFQRKQRSDSVHETNLLCKKRDNDGNKIINDYVVVKELGRGSFAKVKLVQHIDTHELFALKILKRQRSHSFNLTQFTSQHVWPSSSTNNNNNNNNTFTQATAALSEPEQHYSEHQSEENNAPQRSSFNTEIISQRFRSQHNNLAAGINNDDLLREIAVMKFINHPNVVTLKEVIDDADANKVYIIMEYCENGPMHTWGQPPLPLCKVRRYGCDILKGLLHLHSEFLYHRDVKPANCLIDGKNVAKLADFGTCTSRIMSSTTEGTLAYSCPEQVRGENVAGDVVDSWAFAMTLYESAFGALPFKLDTVSTWQRQISGPEEIVIPSTMQQPITVVGEQEEGKVVCGISNNNNDSNNNDNKSSKSETTKEVVVDADFRDLLQRMLCKDLNKRMLLSEAAAHSFFTHEQDVDLAASLRSFGSLLRSIQVAGSNRPSVTELYDRALDAVHRGSHVQNSFHGIRAMKKIQRKSKKSKLNDSMDFLDDEVLINEETSLNELTLDNNSTNTEKVAEGNNMESNIIDNNNNGAVATIINTEFCFPAQEYDVFLSPNDATLPYSSEVSVPKQSPEQKNEREELGKHTNNNNSKIYKCDDKLVCSWEQRKQDNEAAMIASNEARYSKDVKCVKYVQVKMNELPLSLSTLAPTLERIVCQYNTLRSIGSLAFNKFTLLKDVAITHNHLTEFPISVLEAPHLLRLDLSCNKIAVIPAELTKARFLERLNLHNNAIHDIGVTSIAEEVPELTSTTLTNVTSNNNNNNNNNDNSSSSSNKKENNIYINNDMIATTVKSVLAAPCLSHVRLTNNELERLPFALYSARRSLELVLDANPKLINEWNEMLHDRRESLPILTSYLDMSETTCEDDKRKKRRSFSLSKSPSSTTLAVVAKRKSSAAQKQKQQRRKSEEEKITTDTTREVKEDDTDIVSVCSKSAKAPDENLIEMTLNPHVLSNSLRKMIRQRTVIVWDDSFPVRVANTTFPIWIASGIMNGYNIHTLHSCKTRHVVLFKTVDKRLPCGEFTSAELQLYLHNIMNPCPTNNNKNNNNNNNNNSNNNNNNITKSGNVQGKKKSHSKGTSPKVAQLTSVGDHVFRFVNTLRLGKKKTSNHNSNIDKTHDVDKNESNGTGKNIHNDTINRQDVYRLLEEKEEEEKLLLEEELLEEEERLPLFSAKDVNANNNNHNNGDGDNSNNYNNNNSNAQVNESRRSSVSNAPLPPLVNREACNYVLDYFIVGSVAEDGQGGYWALYRYLEKILTQPQSVSCTSEVIDVKRSGSTHSIPLQSTEETPTKRSKKLSRQSSSKAFSNNVSSNNNINGNTKKASSSSLLHNGHSVLIVVNGGSGAAHDTRELTIAAISALLNKLSPTLRALEMSSDSKKSNNDNNEAKNIGLEAKFEDVMAAMKGMYE